MYRTESLGIFDFSCLSAFCFGDFSTRGGLDLKKQIPELKSFQK